MIYTATKYCTNTVNVHIHIIHYCEEHHEKKYFLYGYVLHYRNLCVTFYFASHELFAVFKNNKLSPYFKWDVNI